MTYKIYTTDAFVIKTRQSRDADLSVLLFTQDLGLLNGVAKSARQQRSKLKYALQSLTFSSLSFVKGKEVWRITSAKKLISLYDPRLAPEVRAMLARILLFIERFCPREQPELEIFELMKNVSGFVFKEISRDPDIHLYIEPIEYYFMLNAMFYLGYVKNTETMTQLIDAPINIELMKKLQDEELRLAVQKSIEKGMVESHL